MGTQNVMDIGKERVFGIGNKNFAVSFEGGIKQSGILKAV